MENTRSSFYSVMVVGDNPEELMEQYKIGRKVERYLKYKYLDAEKLQKENIKLYNKILEADKSRNMLNPSVVSTIRKMIKTISNLTPFEYYQTITYGCDYDDEGNAWSDVMSDGKWDNYQKGNHFSTPLINNKGEEVTSEINSKINWKLLHMQDKQLYETVWDLVMEHKEPTSDDEKIIFENMKNRTEYLSSFKNKEEYVAHSASYWNYAYLDKNGWIDVDDEQGKDIEWKINFYQRFIVPLKPDDRVTIFEYTRNNYEM